MAERLKVMIADDEPMVCVVVQSSIHWEELELELVGVAHDGLELMEKMKAAKPDIIITDISMPELSGLDFIEQVRRENGTCRFIIISGYRQFEYAHKALKNNVEDYLLKPIDEQELNETLLRLKTAILGERMHDPEVVERLMTNNQKDKENIRRIFLEQLLAQDAAPNLDEDAIARQYGIQFGDGIYQAVEAKFDVSSQENLDTSLASIQTKLISIFRKIFEKDCGEILVGTKKDRILFGIYYGREHACTADSNLKKFYEYGKNIVELFMGFALTVGVSEKHDCLSDLPQAFREARDAIRFRLVEGINRIIFYENLNIPEKRWNEAEMEEIRKKLDVDFEIQNIEAFQFYIAELYFVEKEVCNAPEMVQLSMEIVDLFFEKQKALGNEIDNREYQYEAAMQKIANAVSIRQLKLAVSSSITELMTELEEKRKNQKKKPVREALAYISRHYKESLTLEVLAEEVNLNPVYFSNLFKKETGENFVDYLHKYRIEVAKDLLRNEDTPIANIALEVGYYDAKYFSKMFKKYVGIKPSDYRKIYG